jgi:retron-type reverse transcriptase
MTTDPRARFLRNLAAAFATSEWTAAGLRAAAVRATGERFRWTAPLIGRLLAGFPQRLPFERVVAFLEQDTGLARACAGMARRGYAGERFPVLTVFVPPAAMGQPPAALGPLSIPALATEAALARWLGVSVGKLQWYADPAGRNRKHPAGALRTYRHRWVAKPGGRRLLEIPSAGLKRLQRKILAEILDHIPPHPAAHGFRRGRSVVTNAAPHAGKRIVLRFDLADFFPSIPVGRVLHTFRTVGYPETVARLLTGLCTTRLPSDVWEARPNPANDGTEYAARVRLVSRHVPQGAPTSPALANLAALRLDRRLAKLASLLDADYTRYADDLTFSGGELLARRAKRIRLVVAVIAADEGFAVNHRKTRVMGRGGRQHVTGVVVNVRPNVPRAEFDKLKAILTNCLRRDPASQNRGNHPDFRAHLAGKVSHAAMVNPTRGRKLWALFDKIKWAHTPG